MRSHVFTDGRLAKHAGRFVWLSIDTEKAVNAPFIERFPLENWPTLFVIDPTTETAAFKWLGSATPEQLERLLDDAERAVRHTSGAGVSAVLAQADRLAGERKPQEAAAAYRKALDQAPADWPARPRAIESLVQSLYLTRDLLACASTAEQEAPRMPRGPSFANAAALGLSCALGLEVQAADRPRLVKALGEAVAEALPLPGLLADDRSGLYDLLIDVRKDAGDKAGATALADQWWAFLAEAADKAPTPDARAAFDSHRLAAALRLGDPARVLPVLERSEAELPHDYNPPARKAVVYLELSRFDEALAAVERALGKVSGPRRLRVLESKATILAKKGDKRAAQAVLEEALTRAQMLPAAQRPEGTIKRIEGTLAKLKAAPSP